MRYLAPLLFLTAWGGASGGEGAVGGFTVTLEDGAIAIAHADGLRLSTAPAQAFSFRRTSATYESSSAPS